MVVTSRTNSRASNNDALRRIVEGTAGATGREFFRSLARHLAGVLGYRYAVVAELVSPKPARLHTLAVWDEDSDVDAIGSGFGSGIGSGFGSAASGGIWGGGAASGTARADRGNGNGREGNGRESGGSATAAPPIAGRFSANFDYAVPNTPGEYVVGKKPCHYPQGVRRLFPNDTVLERLGVESYLGVPLFNAAGHALGLLAVMGDRPSPTEDAAHAQSILKTFAPRAAAELERLRREAALRETGQRYQTLAETSPVGIFHADPPGNWTYLNARCCEIVGLPAEEAFGDGWMRHVHPDDRDVVLDVHDAHAQAGKSVAVPFSLEYRFVHPDGHVVWVVGQVAPQRSADDGDAAGEVTGYVGTITDITETKRAEEELRGAYASLRRSEQRYQALSENSAVGIWQIRPDGDTLYINPTMRQMLELGPGEELRSADGSFHSFFTPESQERMRLEHAKRPGGVASSYEVELVGRRGTRRNVVISGAPVLGADGKVESLIGTFTDITERKKIEEALRASEQSLRENEARLRLMVEQVPTVLWTTDADLRFTSTAGAGLAALGVKGADLADRVVHLQEIFPSGEVGGPAIAAHRRALEGVSSTYEQDWNGRTFQAHVEPLRDADGRVTGAIGVAVDVTDRKRAEEVLRESRDELEERVLMRTAELVEANRALQHEVLERRTAEAALQEAYASLRHSESSLRQSEQRYASILNTQQTLVSRSDISGRITYVNAAHSRTFGSNVGDSLFVKVHPDDIAPTTRAMEALVRPPYTCILEQRCEVEGQWRTFLWQVGVIRGEDDKIVEYQGVGFDITDRRRAEEAMRESERHAREMAEQARDAAERARDAAEFNRRLVLEVDHRVRNNLAGLLSLVSAMRDNARDVRSFAGAIEGRLMAMVHTHQLLADTGWRSVELRTLVTTLLAAVERLGPHAAAVEVEGPSVPASPRQALPLSMILLEWFTNSGKYGAHSVPTGKVRVEWVLVPGAGGGGAGGKPQPPMVRLRWKETGGPTVRDREPSGSLGTELVRGFATLELRGRYEPRYPASGAEYLLEFPVQEQPVAPGQVVAPTASGNGNGNDVAQGGVAATRLPLAGAAAVAREPAASPPASRTTQRRR